MLFVLALVAAVGYMFLTKQTIEANITDQVNEFLSLSSKRLHTSVFKTRQTPRSRGD
jgi:hypothetical protein